MSKTLVLDITELYRIIPECNALEGKNFKDVRELLKNLIAAIEKNGAWQFIQYINNKPSLFVIREETSDNINISMLKGKLQKLVKEAETNVKAIQDAAPAGILSGQFESKPNHPDLVNAPYEDTEDIEQPSGSSVPSAKLPWEK